MSFDIDNFPISETGKRLLSYVTAGWYDKSYVGKWLYELLGQELDIADSYLEDFPNQLFPETATWGMRYHEQKYGLDVREDMSLEERRMRVLEKRNTRAPTTPWRMEYILSGALGCNVQISDIMEGANVSHPNKFHARFYGDSEIDLKTAVEKLDVMKQSHTTYDLACTIAVMELAEKIFFNKCTYRFPFTFWDGILDGVYLLDGSIYLDSSYPPYFIEKIKVDILSEESFGVGSNNILPAFDNGYEVISRACERFVARWNDDYVVNLDGEYVLDGTLSLDNSEHPLWDVERLRFVADQGEDVKFSLFIPANAVYLNGQKLLDGTYFLNEGREEL